MIELRLLRLKRTENKNFLKLSSRDFISKSEQVLMSTRIDGLKLNQNNLDNLTIRINLIQKITDRKSPFLET